MLFELLCSILLALLIGCSFVIIVRPSFSGLLNIEMGMSQIVSLFAICGTGIMILILLIGFVLFWRLSQLALRPRPGIQSTRQPALRRIAITLQLAVSVVFIIAAWVVMMQMHFVSHKDLGFDISRVIHVSGISSIPMDNAATLMSEIATMPQIENYTFAYF
jgi:putative ABC transport system permease protein